MRIPLPYASTLLPISRVQELRICLGCLLLRNLGRALVHYSVEKMILMHDAIPSTPKNH